MAAATCCLLAGPVLCVTTITLIGLAPDPVTLALVLVLGGLGGAAFHPPAAALVHRFSGKQRGMAMSTHITSGTLGQAMAPLVFAPFVQQFGLRATPLLMIPALIALLVLPAAPHPDRSSGCRSITKPAGSPRFDRTRSR